jgi:hypothetical protein
MAESLSEVGKAAQDIANHAPQCTVAHFKIQGKILIYSCTGDPGSICPRPPEIQ